MYKGLHVKYRHSRQILMKLEYSQNIFEKFSNIKFHENPSSGSRVVTCGRTVRHNKVNSISSHICNTSLILHVCNAGFYMYTHRSKTEFIHSVFCIFSIYRGADKSLARPTSRCTLFDGENISFHASLVIYI
jgi:hypothetical protein